MMEPELENLRRKLESTTYLPGELEKEFDDVIAKKSAAGVAPLALLRVLCNDVMRLKSAEATLKVSIERCDRDTVKSNIMLNLLQDQVSHSKDHAERITYELRDATAKNIALDIRVEDLAAKLSASVAAEQHVARLLDDETKARRREEDLRTTTTSHSEETLDGLRKELDRTKVRFVTYVADAEAKSKEAYQAHVNVKVALHRSESDATAAQEETHRELRSTLERAVNAEQKAKHIMHELSTVKSRNLEEQKSQHEMLAVLRTELEKARLTIAQKDAMINTTTKETVGRVIELQEQVERLQEDLLQERSMFTSSQKQHATQSAKAKAENTALHTEMTSVSEELIAKQRLHMEATVSARVEGETLRTKIHSAETDRDHFKSKYREMEVKLKSENEGLRRVGRDDVRAHDADIAVLRDELVRTSGELKISSRRLVEHEHSLQERERHFAVTSEAHAKETATLKAEVTGYRQSVRQLEAHIAENINFKIVQEKCDSLESQLVSARNQVLHLNHVVADMRVESEIVEQYRVKVLQERYDDLAKETTTLRAQARFCLPLLDETLTVLQREASAPGKIPAAMRKEIEVYQREYAHVPAAVSVYSVA